MPLAHMVLVITCIPFLPSALCSLPLPQALLFVLTFTGEGLHLPPTTHTGHPPPQKEPSKGFRLASIFGPVPDKLAQRIQALHVADMMELLQENITHLWHMEALDSPNSPVPWATGAQPWLRKINSLISWVLCSVTYLAILSESPHDLVRSCLTYLALVVSKARHNGGDSWIAYDAIFHQSAAEDEVVDWTRLDSSLHTAMYIALSSGAKFIWPPCS